MVDTGPQDAHEDHFGSRQLMYVSCILLVIPEQAAFASVLSGAALTVGSSRRALAERMLSRRLLICPPVLTAASSPADSAVLHSPHTVHPDKPSAETSPMPCHQRPCRRWHCLQSGKSWYGCSRSPVPAEADSVVLGPLRVQPDGRQRARMHPPQPRLLHNPQRFSEAVSSLGSRTASSRCLTLALWFQFLHGSVELTASGYW